MRAVERGVYGDARAAGAAHAAIGAGLGLAAGSLVGSTAVATWIAVAGRGLGEAATGVGDALAAGDLAAARSLLPGLVGRDPTGLDEKEVSRAVVESVAENTVDAVVAPALWAACLGARGALAYRAVNTLDAMVGHLSERHRNYGWASARLDDVAGWLPARVTAALVATVRPRTAPAVWEAVRTQAPAHPSPNAGVAEAAFAAAMGVRLGGENRYGDRTEVRPTLGTGRTAEPGDIAAAVRLSRDVSFALAGALALWGLA
jgi:adenosylcobinamide-phosphate synthase